MSHRIKTIIPQLLALFFVIAIIAFFTINAQLNMDERGIDFGYGFDSSDFSNTGQPSGWQTHFVIGQQF